MALLLAAAVAAGCSGDHQAPTDAAPTTRDVTSASPSSNTAVPERLTFEDAVPIGDSVRVLARIPGTDRGGKWQGVAAVTPDGMLVLRVTKPGTGEQLTKDELRLANPEELVHAETVDRSPAGTQAYGAVANRRDVVWMTSTSTRLESWPWTLWAYDRASGGVSELTHSTRIGGEDPPEVPGFTGPTISGDRAYWAQYHGTQKRPQVDIMVCRISHCRPRLAARRGILPVATRDSLYFIHPGVRGASGPVELRRRSSATGEITTVTQLGRGGEATPSGLAANGDVVAWTRREGRRGAITIQNLRTSEDIVISSRTGGNFAFPVATERFVAWAEASGTSRDQLGGYLYDLREDTLYELGNRSGFYAITGTGDTITWQEQTKKTEQSNRAITVVGQLR